MEQESPPITIVDPSHGTEVLVSGAERESWRTVLVGLVLALLVGAAVVADTLRDDRVADRSAVASLRITTDGASDSGTAPSGTVRLAVRNDGPEAVRVLSARLLAPGYAEVPLHARVPAGGLVTLTFRDAARCGPELLTQPADVVSVRLRTARGNVVTRSLPLSPQAYTDVNHAAWVRCGYLPADEAFAFRGTSVTVQGSAVVVTAELVNRSLLPLALYRLQPMPGLAIALMHPLPIALPVQSRPDAADATVVVRMRLSVANCHTFLTTLGYPHLTTAGGGVVRGYVVRDATLYEVTMLRLGRTGSFESRVDVSALLQDLLTTCPDVVIP